MTPLTPEDRELDRLWRLMFNQPLPMLGAPDVARAILAQHAKVSPTKA